MSQLGGNEFKRECLDSEKQHQAIVRDVNDVTYRLPPTNRDQPQHPSIIPSSLGHSFIHHSLIHLFIHIFSKFFVGLSCSLIHSSFIHFHSFIHSSYKDVSLYVILHPLIFNNSISCNHSFNRHVCLWVILSFIHNSVSLSVNKY